MSMPQVERGLAPVAEAFVLVGDADSDAKPTATTMPVGHAEPAARTSPVGDAELLLLHCHAGSPPAMAEPTGGHGQVSCAGLRRSVGKQCWSAFLCK